LVKKHEKTGFGPIFIIKLVKCPKSDGGSWKIFVENMVLK
jgi:hypothetical protein